MPRKRQKERRRRQLIYTYYTSSIQKMGFVLSKLWSALYGSEEIKVVVVGLDNAGKTTTLYKL